MCHSLTGSIFPFLVICKIMVYLRIGAASCHEIRMSDTMHSPQRGNSVSLSWSPCSDPLCSIYPTAGTDLGKRGGEVRMILLSASQSAFPPAGLYHRLFITVWASGLWDKCNEMKPAAFPFALRGASTVGHCSDCVGFYYLVLIILLHPGIKSPPAGHLWKCESFQSSREEACSWLGNRNLEGRKVREIPAFSWLYSLDPDFEMSPESSRSSLR